MAEIISILSAEKILKKMGAKRVSNRAAEEFADLLEHIGMILAKEAVEASEHAGRLTVKEEDIKFVMRRRIGEITLK